MSICARTIVKFSGALAVLGAVGIAQAAPITIFNPDTQIGNMITTDNANPDDEVIKTADSATPPPPGSGLNQTMRLTTQNQVNGEFWKVRDGTHNSWSGTENALNKPIEIELYISPQDAENLPDAGVPQNIDREMMEFRFGNNGTNSGAPGNDQAISVRLTRRFFLDYNDQDGVQARSDRTGQWIVLSIQRDEDGYPTGLEVGSYDTDDYTPVAVRTANNQVPGLPNQGDPGDIGSEAELRNYPNQNNGNLVNWPNATMKRIEMFGDAPGELSFNIGRITVGRAIPEPTSAGLLLVGGALLAGTRRRRRGE